MVDTSKMVKAKVWVLDRRPLGEPTIEDFKLLEEDLPPCSDGDVVIAAECLSVDPYMRYRARKMPLKTTMPGGQVARVLESKSPSWRVGQYMVCYPGWRSHTLVTAKELKEGGLGSYTPLPDLKDFPKSTGLGVVGMPGNTAYFGFLELCQPKSGETVLVNGAAGAVGSAVVQIAKIKGCKVIASAGSQEKCEWVKSLGADHVFNYKTTSVTQALKDAAPDGINCYFDNVGGQFTLEALPHMADFGRVSLCGAISTYNDETRDKGQLVANSPFDAGLIITKQLRVEGFLVPRWIARWMEGLNQLKQWVVEGKLKYQETVTEGFENMPKAFIGLFHGDNIGKAIVNV
ncbi:prostaglandin reductase 1-like isoform X1 [Homarus americanus]|uniref:prostaglandin reductase 1-like isoform X1 n=2 Tax=Homarus americanus TaxID=6706 RepID=UPI001C463BCF|nr:prostaglandin reductase 1-like isoform X1 [Homarus americanus]